ncbi:hypothetical protein HY213_03295 [Candidatus Peregrinibacteria bacterium]|nr:hypothetical protein [Candidatus Peregrinibacteria bacterium]
MKPVLNPRVLDAILDTTDTPPWRDDPQAASSPVPSLQEILQILRERIWQRRPILGEIMQKHGGKTLHHYAQDFLDVNPSPLLDERKPELIEVARQIIEKRLGKETADHVARQLARLPLVSTTDHHSTIDHPFWVNANIISAIPYLGLMDPAMRHLVVFSFSSVSLNNASGYPRGMLFHGGMNGSGNLIRLPILPDTVKMSTVYGTRAFTRDDITKAESQLLKREKAGDIAAGRGEKIRALLEREFARPDVLAAPDLCSQITMINHALWPKLFHATWHRPAQTIPDLLYLEIETLVKELLLQKHLDDPTSLLHRFLFDPACTPLVHEHFNNLPGAFSLEKEWGTYLFWALDDENHRVRLKLENGVLRSFGGTIAVPCTPEGVGNALQRGRIFPSMLTCYLAVALYYGFKCLGGFCQVHDLTLVKQSWARMLRAMGENEEADAIMPIQTKELGGDGMVLTYFKTVKNEIVPATGVDMILEDADTSFERYVDLSRRIMLTEAMQSMLPEMYTVLYPSEERDQTLASVKPERILAGTGLRSKILAEREEWNTVHEGKDHCLCH